MYELLIAAGLSATLELITYLLQPKLAALRWIAALMASMGVLAAAVVTVQIHFNVITLFITVVYGLRLFNLARIMKGRMHRNYLWRSVWTTGSRLIAAQLLLIVLAGAWEYSGSSAAVLLTVAGLVQLVLALVFLRSIYSHYKKMSSTGELEPTRDKDLPSLTVAIPARNETSGLEACVASLLASQYPKLEVLVLDDCSQTSRPAEIIRSFAHAGVRFIRGDEPGPTWLAKNHAYARLAEAASGDLVLFCGVDVRFEPGSLRRIVGYMENKRKNMLCVMPKNVRPTPMPLIQPMRYAWELAIPRKLIGRPPVLSSCWLIRRESLQDAGGFEAVKRTVTPEAYFAKQQMADDAYSFLASGQTLGVSSHKSLREQRDTAIRVTYPQMHRRPELAALQTLIYVLWTALPLLLVLFSDSLVLAAIAAASMAVMLTGYGLLLHLAYGSISVSALLALPLASLAYVVTMNYSMYRYEFSEVIWKGRNVCIPVMHVVPSLPKS